MGRTFKKSDYRHHCLPGYVCVYLFEALQRNIWKKNPKKLLSTFFWCVTWDFPAVNEWPCCWINCPLYCMYSYLMWLLQQVGQELINSYIITGTVQDMEKTRHDTFLSAHLSCVLFPFCPFALDSVFLEMDLLLETQSQLSRLCLDSCAPPPHPASDCVDVGS